MVNYAEILGAILIVTLLILRTIDNFLIIKDSLKSGIAREFIFGVFLRRNGVTLYGFCRKKEPFSFWFMVFLYLLEILIFSGFLIFAALLVYVNNFK